MQEYVRRKERVPVPEKAHQAEGRGHRPDERHVEVVNEVFDLFANLDASEEQLDFPILYGSAKQGWMSLDPKEPITPTTIAGNR